ncbi:Bacterial type II/III secretion system short domain protein [Pseudomonas brassicacearum]|uniref:hypothetical protein n=1 Tax=Pseudomonas brassicacearum TaxID=930166 RepID=UPI0039E338F0
MKSTPILQCAVYAAILSVTGCTTSIVGSSSTSTSGVAYMLPKSLLPVELSDTGNGFTFSVGEPVLKGDPSKRFILTRAGNPFSSDKVDIAVVPSTGLLESVKVDSKDESLNVVSNIIKTLVAESATADAGGSSTTLVYRGLIDPEGDTSQVNAKLNAAIKKHLEVRKNFACKRDQAADACNTAKDLTELYDFGKFEIVVVKSDKNPVVTEGASIVGEPVASDADCKKGVCYRVNQPYLITLNGPNGSSQQAYVGLPNGSPTYVLPVDRWPFVQNTHDIKLQDGLLKSVDTVKPSSALAASAAPIEIVRAAFGAISELVQLRIDSSGKYAALAKQEAETIKAKSELDKAQISAGALNAESSLYGEKKSNDGLISIHIGLGTAKSGSAIDGLDDQDKNSGGPGGVDKTLPSHNGTVGQ